MTNVHASTRPSEQGFTLVELAIVMVIIGLLIGGILKGQELIANAKISGTVGQVKGLDAAMNTFYDKYAARPGLMSNATTRLAGCAAPCANVTAANYGTSLAPPAAVGAAGVQAFLHLSAADLISGIDASATTPLAFGGALPTVKAGGGMWVAQTNTTAELGTTTLSPTKPYAVLNGNLTAIGGTNGALSPTTAAQIDRKLDDGVPRTGSVQAGGTNCVGTGTPAAYDEANGTGTCTVAATVLN